MAGQKGRKPKARLAYTQLQAYFYHREGGGGEHVRNLLKESRMFWAMWTQREHSVEAKEATF